MNTSEFAQGLADKLIEQLETGTAPWQQPWSTGQSFAPYNPVTGNRYRGVNFLALLSAGYSDPRWMTYKQAQAQGWQVSAGEKSTRIQHWIWEEERIRTGKDGQPVLDENKKPIKETIRLVRPKVIMAAVFNAVQIEGIPELERGREYDWDPIEQAEKLLKASNAKIRHSSQDRPHYRLSTDTIHLPSREQFPTPADYYSTALHELGHWTGHPERMNRDLANPFGSTGYAREELRAEIASLILGSEIGIGYDPGQHAAYVENWVQILRDKPNEILYAAAEAEKISDYVLGIEQKQELRKSQEIQSMIEELREVWAGRWETTNKSPSPQEIAGYVDHIFAAGTLVDVPCILIAEGRRIDVKEAVMLKTEYESDIEHGQWEDAGMFLANYIWKIGGLKESSLELVPRISEVTKDQTVRQKFMEGFRGGTRPEGEDICRKLEERFDREHTQEAEVKKTEIPYAERTYLAVPYDERDQAKAVGARWDAVKKAWYVGPGVDPERIAKWELRHQETPTLDARAEFAAVLRSLGALVEGEHPIMNGEPQRIQAEKDKRGEQTIFYVGHLDGVANGYAENNRTKEVRRWKARGQTLSEEQKTELLAQAEQKRYQRRQAEQARFEATAARLSGELGALPSGVEKTAYHEAKGIDALPGAPVRNGDMLVPGYDIEGKLWTVQYIKEDGTKRFAKESRKHGCFHVIGAANAVAGLQKLEISPVIAIAEGYATAATVGKYGDITSIAAFDSGNLLAVASALHERWPEKRILIAGDDDHGVENNPGRVKALGASLAVHGMVVFPNLSEEQRSKGMTDFNDLARENSALVKQQLEEALWRARQEGQEQTGEIGKGVLRLDSWAGRGEIPCEILKETPHRFLVRLEKDCLLPGGRQATKGQEVYVPKDAIRRALEPIAEQSGAQAMELGHTSRAEAERQLYRTTTVDQLVAALVESRDQTDIRHVFEHHEGGTRGFEIACQRLGISKDDWTYANNVAGCHALVGIIGNKLGLPRYDPAAEQARREEVAAIIKSPVRAATQSVELAQGLT